MPPSFQRTEVEGRRAQRVEIREAGGALSWGDVHRRWRSDPGFCSAFAGALAETPYTAFLWETPPVSASTEDQRFEMALLDSPALAGVSPTPEPFEERIGDGRGTDEVRTFLNLGGDAELVVPCAHGSDDPYAHLGAFVRSARPEQVRELWQTVGTAVARRLTTTHERFWVSTSGLGVYWVHVRLDARPKYYAFDPYRR